jgi:hypothetical protein
MHAGLSPNKARRSLRSALLVDASQHEVPSILRLCRRLGSGCADGCRRRISCLQDALPHAQPSSVIEPADVSDVQHLSWAMQLPGKLEGGKRDQSLSAAQRLRSACSEASCDEPCRSRLDPCLRLPR